MRLTPIFSLCFLAAVSLARAREVVDFGAGWRFDRADPAGAAAAGFDDHAWQPVTIPHTFDLDTDPPAKNYYRGPAWYRKSFATDPAWKGRRVFLRFEAASLVADVSLNGQRLGEHRGGFTAFGFELTDRLNPTGGAPNVLAVRVDNARREDVIPLGGDFTVYGGLYRPVSLLVMAASAPADVAVAYTFDARGDAHVTVGNLSGSAECSILDAAGAVVARSDDGRLVVPQPHRWNGVADPYLYRVRIDYPAQGTPLDTSEVEIGFRTVAVDPHRGFLLNGKPLQIHGVDRHQDWAGTGWAISHAQQDTDLKIMREMGVTGVRLAHYPHNQYFYSLCDRAGLLVWAELPLVNDVRGTPEFLANAKQQLTELIEQSRNHPSIVFWSLYNEPSPKNPVPVAPIIAELKALAKRLDPSRLTTGALAMDGAKKLPAVGKLNDVLAINPYPGWYLGTADDMGAILDQTNAAYGSHGLIVSEYGAGANIAQHQADFTGRPPGRAPAAWHPEEWQAIVHEKNYAAIRARPFVYGSFVWNQFDFASAGRNEGGTPGINDKGLVTRDRKTRKDAYYFYQANWTTAPMVHLTSARFTPRPAGAVTVKAYSNCAAVELFLDGRSLGTVHPDDLHRARWPSVRLTPGHHELEARAPDGVTDHCSWDATGA